MEIERIHKILFPNTRNSTIQFGSLRRWLSIPTTVRWITGGFNKANPLIERNTHGILFISQTTSTQSHNFSSTVQIVRYFMSSILLTVPVFLVCRAVPASPAPGMGQPSSDSFPPPQDSIEQGAKHLAHAAIIRNFRPTHGVSPRGRQSPFLSKSSPITRNLPIRFSLVAAISCSPRIRSHWF
jgi:hypothetical protein